MKIIISNPGHFMEERPVKCVTETRGPVAKITAETDQTILGFGAALTESACIMINKLSEEDRKCLMHKVYSPEEDNFSVTRLCVGASDYAEMPYDFAPVADDMTMEHFDASHDDIDIIPVVKEALAENPDLYLYSSPWSPPGWMKSSHSMYGGWMLEKYLDAYTLYYLKFLQHYRDHGIELKALTPQNESETDQSSRMPACLWHPEIEMKFAQKLRKLLDENEFKDLKIWLVDHNFIMWHRAVFQMDDPATKAACAGIAWHPYEGHPQQINDFRKQHPDCENHWTEGDFIPFIFGLGLNSGLGSFRFMPHHFAKSYIEGLKNGIQSITLWNLALDPEGYPNIGPFQCRGSVEITRDGKMRIADDYKALVHFSKYIQRGAKRLIVDDSALPQNFSIAAFKNPDGTTVVLISNSQTFDSELNLEIDGKKIELWMLRESVNTVIL